MADKGVLLLLVVWPLLTALPTALTPYDSLPPRGMKVSGPNPVFSDSTLEGELGTLSQSDKGAGYFVTV